MSNLAEVHLWEELVGAVAQTEPSAFARFEYRWATYHRHVVSKRVFARIDYAIFRQTWRWACARHPRKGRRWIKHKYFDRVKNRDWWFFGTDTPRGKPLAQVHLFHATSVRILRHVSVRNALNPYDPAWFNYLAERTRRRSATAAPNQTAFVQA